MTTPTLEQLLDAGEYHARMCLLELRQAQLLPFYHLVTADADQPDAIIPCEFADDSDKLLSMALATAVARTIGAVAVLFVTEAWAVVVPRDASPDGSEDREEIVGLSVSDGREHRQRSLLIIRNRGGEIIKLTRRFNRDQIILGGMIDGIIENTSTTH